MPSFLFRYRFAVPLLGLLAGGAFAASVDSVNVGGYLTNIGGTTTGSQGSVVIDPAGVHGWANWNAASLTPSFSGGSVPLTLAQVGSFTLSTITDNRFRDAHGSGPTTDTIGVRGNSAGGLAAGEGFQVSFVPGAVGSYKLTVHTTDFGGATNWAVGAGATSLGSGVLPNSTGLDEGPVEFNVTVATTTEASATWTIQFTSGGATALTVNSASLISTTPPEPPAPVAGLGKLLCIGDSITEGRATRPDGEGNWSWRYWCWQNFVDFGIAHEFVGTRTANKDGSSVYPAYSGQSFVNRHEAIWGTTFLERSSSVPAFLGSLKTSGKTPDTAVIFGGGNDIPLDLSPDLSPASWTLLVPQSLNPGEWMPVTHANTSELPTRWFFRAVAP